MNDTHPHLSDQRHSIYWARSLLRNKNKYVILDTETTGLGEDDEIIAIAVIDLDGNILVNKRLYPTKARKISKAASSVHGITMSDLEGCPYYADISKDLKSAIGKRNVITYNAAFDEKLIRQTYNLSKGLFRNPAFMPKGPWLCAMKQFARFIGQWNEYHNDYRWQKLDGFTSNADHTALGDCKGTLEIIHIMAEEKIRKKWYEFWKIFIRKEI